MITQFYKLTEEEQELLYKVPVLISVLATCFCGNQKRPNAQAIRSAYLKTFMVNPILLPCYNEIERRFIGLFEKYATHVKRTANIVCSDLIFPTAIPVLADK